MSRADKISIAILAAILITGFVTIIAVSSAQLEKGKAQWHHVED